MRGTGIKRGKGGTQSFVLLATEQRQANKKALLLGPILLVTGGALIYDHHTIISSVAITFKGNIMLIKLCFFINIMGKLLY